MSNSKSNLVKYKPSANVRLLVPKRSLRPAISILKNGFSFNAVFFEEYPRLRRSRYVAPFYDDTRKAFVFRFLPKQHSGAYSLVVSTSRGRGRFLNLPTAFSR